MKEFIAYIIGTVGIVLITWGMAGEPEEVRVEVPVEVRVEVPIEVPVFPKDHSCEDSHIYTAWESYASYDIELDGSHIGLSFIQKRICQKCNIFEFRQEKIYLNKDDK